MRGGPAGECIAMHPRRGINNHCANWKSSNVASDYILDKNPGRDAIQDTNAIRGIFYFGCLELFPKGFNFRFHFKSVSSLC